MNLHIQNAGLLSSLIGGAGGNSAQTTVRGEDFSSLLSSLLGIDFQGDAKTVQMLPESPVMMSTAGVSFQTALVGKPGELPTGAPVVRLVQSDESVTVPDDVVEMVPAVITVRNGEGRDIDIPVLIGLLDTSSGDTAESSGHEIPSSAGLLIILNQADTPLLNAGEITTESVSTVAVPDDGSWNFVAGDNDAAHLNFDTARGVDTTLADGPDTSGKHVIADQDRRAGSVQSPSGFESRTSSSIEIPRIVHIGPQKSDMATITTATHDAGTSGGVEPVVAEAVASRTNAIHTLSVMQTLETRMTFEAVTKTPLITQSQTEHGSASPSGAVAVAERATLNVTDTAATVGEATSRTADVFSATEVMVFRSTEGTTTLSVQSSKVTHTPDNTILRLLDALAAQGGQVEAVFTVLSDGAVTLPDAVNSSALPFDSQAVQSATSLSDAIPVESLVGETAPDIAASSEPVRIVIDYGNTVARYRVPRTETAEPVRAGQPSPTVSATTGQIADAAGGDNVSEADAAAMPSRDGIPSAQPEMLPRSATARHDMRAADTLSADSPAVVVNDTAGTDGAEAIEGRNTASASSSGKIKLTVESAPVAEKAAVDVRTDIPETESRPVTDAPTSMKTDTAMSHESLPEAVDTELQSPLADTTVSRSDMRRTESTAAARSGRSAPMGDEAVKVVVSAGQRSIRYVDATVRTSETASATDMAIPGEGPVASDGFADASMSALTDTQPRVDTVSAGRVGAQRTDATQPSDQKAVRATAGRQIVQPERNAGASMSSAGANDIPETATTLSGSATASNDTANIGYTRETVVPASDTPVDMVSVQARGDSDGTFETIARTAVRTPSVIDGRTVRIVHERHEGVSETAAPMPGNDAADSGNPVNHPAPAEPETGVSGITQTSARAASNDSASTGVRAEYAVPNNETVRNAPEVLSAGSVKPSATAEGTPDSGITEQAESQPAVHTVKVANSDKPSLTAKSSAIESRNGTGNAAEPFAVDGTAGLPKPEASEITAAETIAHRTRSDAASTADKGASEPVVSASAGSAGSTASSEAESRTHTSSLDGSHRPGRIEGSANAEKGNHSDSGSMGADGEGGTFDTDIATGKNAAANTANGSEMTTGFESAFRSAAFAESDTTMDKMPAAESTVHGVGQGDAPAEPAASIPVSPKVLASAPPDYDEKILNSIVRQAALMQKNGQSSAVIRLEPPNLGKLKLEIVTEQSKVTGRITVESNEIKQIVENRIAELRHNLNQNGLKVESFDVQVGHNGGTDAWAQRENNERGMRTMHNGDFGGQRRSGAGIAAPSAPQAVRAGIRHTGVIDVMM